jgi:hypothetical protein
MAYRNKTYVIFDADTDMWAYAYMIGWKNSEHIEFDFFDAHDLRKISHAKDEKYIKSVLKDRLKNTKQAVVIVGEKTKYLYRFVRWEIEQCLEMGIPIIVVNLNGARQLDQERCPPLLRGTSTLHISFKAKIMKYAMDEFYENFPKYRQKIDMYYPDSVYQSLGLL